MISKCYNRIADFYTKHEYAAVLFFVLVWQTILLFNAKGILVETDSYTHALRLLDFIQSGSWQEILYRHDNCPFGQILHFTRIADMFLYLTTFPFLPFMELKKAVLFGVFLYNPLIACLSAVALIWAGRAFFSPILRAAGILFYFAQKNIFFLYFAGRPDHHVLLNLLLIMLLGCLTYGAKTQKTAYYKIAGIFGGLAVWATPEGFLSGLFIYAGMVIAWLSRCQNIRQIRLFSQSFFISTALCLLVNPPMQGLFYPDNGRLSVLMVAVLGGAFFSFYIEEFCEKEKYICSFLGRLFSLSACALFFFCLVLFLFGKKALFSSPIPPEIYDIWAAHISELKPGLTGNFISSSAIFFLYVFLLSMCVLQPAAGQIRKQIIINGIPLFIFFVLTVFSRRFGRPGSVFVFFVLLPSLQVFCQNIMVSSQGAARIKQITILFLFFIYAVVTCFSVRDQKSFEQQITEAEKYMPYMPQKEGCILTHSNQGPETAWETGKAVVGSPYHSNAQGIIDGYLALNTTNPAELASLLKKRDIQTILITNPLYALSGKSKNQSDLADKAVRIAKNYALLNQVSIGKLNFCFLRPVPDMPKEVKKRYSIFEVDFTACEKAKEPNF
ncbi:MAG: hypothetical protein J5787_02630 [Alphaproteobacteria bacterium]|nr:hypothetical protein [Alphaproteobacteria bacterium]